jgi:hypothetical protein
VQIIVPLDTPQFFPDLKNIMSFEKVCEIYHIRQSLAIFTFFFTVGKKSLQ